MHSVVSASIDNEIECLKILYISPSKSSCDPDESTFYLH